MTVGVLVGETVGVGVGDKDGVLVGVAVGVREGDANGVAVGVGVAPKNCVMISNNARCSPK